MAEAPTAVKLRNFIEDIYARGTVRGEDGTEHGIFPESVTPDRGAFVRDACRTEKARSVLEIGMAWGPSTLHILESLLSNGAVSMKTKSNKRPSLRSLGSKSSE